MKLFVALLAIDSFSGVTADCSATCLANVTGGPYTCDDLVNAWNAEQNNLEPSDELTCETLESKNCCDCSGCLCGETPINTTTAKPITTLKRIESSAPPITTDTTPSNECTYCWTYLFSTTYFGGVANGVDNQFFDALSNWTALPTHQQVEGCEAAALNGVDCSKCGCDCDPMPLLVNCEQSVSTSNCSASGCGQSGFRDVTYTTITPSEGVGKKCKEDYRIPCATRPCTTTSFETTSEATTTPITNVDTKCTAQFIDGVNVLNTTIVVDGITRDLGGSCESASTVLTCSQILNEFGVDCTRGDQCACLCDPTLTCNARPLWPPSAWPATETQCYSGFGCSDPCTEYIGFPNIPALNATCQELLSKSTQIVVNQLFQFYGESNYCEEMKCCVPYDEGGGIPNNVDGNPEYECFSTTTASVTTSVAPTTGVCDTTIANTGNVAWSANELIANNFSCYQIAGAIGGYYDGVSPDIDNIPFYPTFPPNIEYLDLARQCGCKESCEVSCSGCNELMSLLQNEDFYCDDYIKVFNMNCTECGCTKQPICTLPIIFASEKTQRTYPNESIPLSCDDLSNAGMTCGEIADYTEKHGQAGACASCECTEDPVFSYCDQPRCGGNELLSCNDLIDVDISCEAAKDLGCEQCEQCGCRETTSAFTTVATCDSQIECNQLGLTCDELVQFFTCSELDENIFSGCECSGCCVEQFTEKTCSDNCIQRQNCDYWVSKKVSDRFAYTCDVLETQYGCDCGGCTCTSPTTVPITTHSACESTSCLGGLDCYTVAQETGESYYILESEYNCDCTGCPGCNPNGCEGLSCDDWVEQLAVTCQDLEESFPSCDCQGCRCAQTTPEPATTEKQCFASCSQLNPIFGNINCDQAYDQDETLDCQYLETYFGCDCSGCQCEKVESCLSP